MAVPHLADNEAGDRVFQDGSGFFEGVQIVDHDKRRT
jgi:hypothetical protein